MINPQTQAAFEHAASVDQSAEAILALSRTIRSGGDGALDLAAALFRAAFVTPETLARTYDAAAEGWFGDAVNGPVIAVAATEQPDMAALGALWPAFWDLVRDSSDGVMGALEVTPRTAGLAALLPADYQPRHGQACYAYPEVRSHAAKGLPPRFDLEVLGRCPEGSLGRAFHRQIVDNGFDLEVLDRDALGLASLPAPHDYVNTRMLQSHDLIHLLAGYELTSLHEVGISAFQLSQCGHGYSAQFLGVVATTAALSPVPGAFSFLMDTVLGAWVHGRRSPSLVSLAWEEVWHLPIDQIRETVGIEAFTSPYPADIIEQLTRAA